MSTVKVNIKNVIYWIGGIGIILGALGLSLAGVTGTIGRIVKLPAEYDQFKSEVIARDIIQDSTITAQDKQIHMMLDVNEMTWELLRDMTDNKDGLQLYEFEDDDGELFTVDVRETAEKHKWAFVTKMFIPYQIYIDTDGRMYIMLHHSKKQNTYLQIKD